MQCVSNTFLKQAQVPMCRCSNELAKHTDRLLHIWAVVTNEQEATNLSSVISVSGWFRCKVVSWLRCVKTTWQQRAGSTRAKSRVVCQGLKDVLIYGLIETIYGACQVDTKKPGSATRLVQESNV